jgi:hypothetical protein
MTGNSYWLSGLSQDLLDLWQVIQQITGWAGRPVCQVYISLWIMAEYALRAMPGQRNPEDEESRPIPPVGIDICE